MTNYTADWELMRSELSTHPGIAAPVLKVLSSLNCFTALVDDEGNLVGSRVREFHGDRYVDTLLTEDDHNILLLGLKNALAYLEQK